MEHEQRSLTSSPSLEQAQLSQPLSVDPSSSPIKHDNSIVHQQDENDYGLHCETPEKELNVNKSETKT
jgi:hypothetical protein